MMQKQCQREKARKLQIPERSIRHRSMITVVAVFAILVIVIGATIVIATTEEFPPKTASEQNKLSVWPKAGIELGGGRSDPTRLLHYDNHPFHLRQTCRGYHYQDSNQYDHRCLP